MRVREPDGYSYELIPTFDKHTFVSTGFRFVVYFKDKDGEKMIKDGQRISMLQAEAEAEMYVDLARRGRLVAA
jgi:hypothetical protein